MKETPARGQFTVRGIMIAVAILAGIFGATAWAGRSPFVREVYWFGCQALELGILIPWTPWAGGAGLVVGLMAIGVDRRLWVRRTFWLLGPFVVSLSILSYGVLFRYDSGMSLETLRWRARYLGTDYLMWLPWLHIPIAVALIGRFPRGWLATIGLSSAAAYWSFYSSVVAWMSITNVWL